MRPEAAHAWTQLYAAVGLLAAICAVCALIKTVYDVRSHAVEFRCATTLQKMLCLPRIWLHFQLSYFCGFPCILGIALLYAHYIGFTAFNPS